MDAVKFIEERKRLCKTYVSCSGCPANDNNDRCKLSRTVGDEAAKQVELLEEWSAAHPRKTRQDVLLEQYPDAAIDSGGTIALCPTAFSSAYRDDTEKCVYVSCDKCRREFWMQEVE